MSFTQNFDSSGIVEFSDKIYNNKKIFLIVYIVQNKVFLSDVKLRRKNNCLKFGFENKCRNMKFFYVYENTFAHKSKNDSK